MAARQKRACRICGCTQNRACVGGCAWVEADLCSSCSPAPQLFAYCWATGRIDFGKVVPEGAIEMARGTSRRVRREIARTARLAYDGKTLLVPGIPEAESSNAAVDALGRHLVWLKQREGQGFTVAVRAGA